MLTLFPSFALEQLKKGLVWAWMLLTSHYLYLIILQPSSKTKQEENLHVSVGKSHVDKYLKDPCWFSAGKLSW